MSDNWSDCGMIFYTSGEGYALDVEGNTVCLCSEVDIKKVLSGELSVDSLKNDKQSECMKYILKYREERGYGAQFETVNRGSGNFVRDRFAGNIKYKQKNVRCSSGRKRVPLGNIKQDK